jgi:predicted Rossmann-fold nucleotide-binding protein
VREIENLAALDTVLGRNQPLRNSRFQDLDLTGHEALLLARRDYDGAIVLGGRLTPALDAHLRAHGALIFPTDSSVPVNAYRASLYQPHELYDGLREHGYASTPDARAYWWAKEGHDRHDAYVTLLRAIHDDSMSDALTEALGDAPVVGVMGGHSLGRDTEGFAVAAALGHALAGAGVIVATGGGPGAMEAANLGAFATDHDGLDEALDALRAVPGFAGDATAWAGVALDAYDILAPRSSTQVRSVGIPTWFYGHEPPNVFCTGIAKYFSNAVREDGLLARCTAGVVVLEGAAGTVQEVFQAATRLYYPGDPGENDPPLPHLVLVGRRHWTEVIPVWPTLRALASGRRMERYLHLADDPAEAVDLVVSP